MAGKHIDYSVIEADNPAELVEAVHNAIQDGWQCHGGVCVWFEPHRAGPGPVMPAAGIVHYAQALVRPAPAG